MLGASHAIKDQKPPIASLEDIWQSDYKLHVSNGSSVEKLFINGGPNSIYKQLIQANKLISDSKDVETFIRMANNSLEEEDLIFGVYQPLRILPEWSCNISSVDIDYFKISNGIIFQKNWRFTELFNYHLLQLKEEGIIDQISNKYYRTNRCPAEPLKSSTLTETKTAYIMLVVGFVASFIFFSCECAFVNMF